MIPKIIFEDADLLVLDKPAGLVVHDGHGQTKATLVDWLTNYLPKSPLKSERYGLLHRLDQDTSGVILVAKTETAFEYYKKLFAKHQLKKTYLTLVHGRVTPDRGLIQIPLARHLVQRTKFEPASTGRVAETEYQVEHHYRGFTYLKAWPVTGRTHQIRVHFSSIGYPIVGDKVYGKADKLDRQFLHAHQIEFIGLNGEKLKFVSPLPQDLKKYLNEIK